MRAAAGVFFLAVFSLLGEGHGHAGDGVGSKPAPRSREAARPEVCAFEPGAIVSDACASYSTLDRLNEHLFPFVHAVTQSTDFFSYYRLNLNNKKCPFWSEEGMCKYETCAVSTVEKEEDLPLAWRAEELSKIEGPKAQHPGRKQQAERKVQKPLQGELGADVGESCVVEYDDECDERDYCVPEDESAAAKGDYVSLLDNPERFTGYAGPSTQQVWGAIYRENCFSKPSKEPVVAVSQSTNPFGSNPLQARAALDLRNVMKEAGTQQGIQQASSEGGSPGFLDGLEFEDSCIEKRVFHRVVSGMHASISTHLCHDYLNRTTGAWGPNLACFQTRLQSHPDRISNLYFNYALLLRAVAKLRSQLSSYSFCAADPSQNLATSRLVLGLVDAIPSAGKSVFDESVMFKGPDALGLKEDFRNRFRNISRVMDCVTCDRCRLWGKIQTNGYGTALKVLFEFDEQNPKNDPLLKRTEVVALINTLDKVSHSLALVRNFEAMLDYEKRGRDAAAGKADGVKTLEPSAESTSQQAYQPPKQQHEKQKPAPPPSSRSASNKHSPQADAPADTNPQTKTPRAAFRANDYPDFSRKPASPDDTVMDAFWEELDLVWRAWVYVMQSWMRLPRKFAEIFFMEVGRLWDFWIGLPVRPRSWEIRFPGRDEL